MTEEYALRSISLGAGVQSSTLYLLAVHGEITPKPDVAIFADTQSEPPWVYDQLDRLEEIGGQQIPIARVTAGSLEQDCLRARDGRSRWAAIPLFTTPQGSGPRGRLRRQCTREYKIDVVRREIRRRVGSGRVQVEEWVGISLDECHRAKPSRYPWITSRWPLLFDKPMRRGECIEWMQSHGYPIPRKSACYFCPFRDDASWAEMKRDAPDVFERAVEFDRAIRAAALRGVQGQCYLHSSLVPLGEVKFKKSAEEQLDFGFGEECEGMCGV